MIAGGDRRLAPSAQQYLKRIEFGNSRPGLDSLFHFEWVLDYGEHTLDEAAESRPWDLRPDPFSSYRSGFEIRTYRRCKRLLLFHRFPELGPGLTLTRSYAFTYDEDEHLSKLVGVSQRGYRRDLPNGPLQHEDLPPLSFGYSEARISNEVQYLEHASLLGIPGGVDGRTSQWVDLDGEGLPGVLTAAADAWYYKANLGSGRLDSPRRLPAIPSARALGDGDHRLMDVGGKGRMALTSQKRPGAGFFARTDDDGWLPFKSFESLPNIDWSSPHLRFVDVDGDGLVDLLLSGDKGFQWYRGVGERGFEPGGIVATPDDEQQGPAVVFSDGTHTIHLADMSGDGLQDIVRVRNGEVCYWPNLGYGRFGPKVTMDRSPVFAPPAEFDPRRVLLADLDGSGVADIVYLGKKVVLYLNQAGNGWGEGIVLQGLPTTNGYADISVVDLLGAGTPCLVRSSSAPADRLQPISFVDVLSSTKPHLLSSISNGMGGETRITYAPSTRFYLEDKEAGRPWLTTAHFPVHVVQRVEKEDRVTGASVVSRYHYRHGRYDGIEREFTGFAQVDRWDAERFGELEHGSPPPGEHVLPPVRTRSWFHNGTWSPDQNLETTLAAEYYDGDPLAPALPPSKLKDVGLEDERDAVRALRGMLLREEVYAEDGLPQQKHPYFVRGNSYEVRQVQSRRPFQSPVFFSHLRDALEIHYERNPADPRISQTSVLEVDSFSNVLKECLIAFARRSGHEPLQLAARIQLIERVVANAPEGVDWHRVGVPIEERISELSGWAPKGGYVQRDLLEDAIGNARRVHFDQEQEPGTILRLFEATQTIFWDDGQQGPLPLGEIESRALPYDTYRMALTSGLVQRAFGPRVDPSLLVTEGGYVQREGMFWAPTGRVRYDENRFFLPYEEQDPFGGISRAAYDAFSLFVSYTEDALGNPTIVETDYQSLQPSSIEDSNKNLTLLAYNASGLIARIVVSGKGEGDTLADPTVSFTYDLLAWTREGKPASTRTVAREQHGSTTTRFQVSYTYTGGFGSEVMQKSQAHPGEAPLRGPDGRLMIGHVAERWIGTGRKVFDNKGNVIKQYEPFFSSTEEFESEADLVEWGVTPIFTYDPLGRLIRTQQPDGTEQRVDLGTWTQRTWDECDSIEGTTWLSERLALTACHPERRAAELSLEHARTPQVVSFDILGRPFRVEDDNGPRGVASTRTDLDIQGNPRKVIDGREVAALEQLFDMLQRPVHSKSVDSGESWTLADALDRPIRSWDGRGFAVRRRYDALGRPTHVFVSEHGKAEALVERTLYGESHPEGENLNLRGRPHLQFDGAGVSTSLRYDLDGNLIHSSRRVAAAYDTDPDWSVLANASTPAEALTLSGPLLEGETYSLESSYDALGRIAWQKVARGAEMRFSYHESNHLRALELKTVGAPWTSILMDSDYNARGQRTRLDCGSGTRSHFTWDEKTFRVRRIHSVRTADAKVLQDLRYVYDAAGNIVEQADEAQQDLYFSNTVVCPLGRYRYDALYRLVEAEGREHPGQQPGSADLPWSTIPHANTTNALIRYTEQYTHDAVGNILQMKHAAGSSSWTRNYRYDTASNRLLATSLPGDPQGGPYSATYTYDAAGNMTSMPHLSSMRWDWAQRLKATSRGGGGDVFYTYDASGQRVRKHYRHAYTDDRVYLGPWEIERRHSGSTLQTERLTIHLFDGDRRLAIVEVLTHADGKPVLSPPPRYRFQIPNHLESACVETDELGRLITYEEYHPFGTTSFRAIGVTPIGLSLKRYRYTGMERDEETSLAYHSARYYAPWLGLWTSPDPLGMVDGTNLYQYSSNSPHGKLDRGGLEPLESTLDATDPRNYSSFESFRAGLPLSMSPEDLLKTWESAHPLPELKQNTGGSSAPRHSIKFDPRDTDLQSKVATLAASPEFQQDFEALDNAPNTVEIIDVDFSRDVIPTADRQLVFKRGGEVALQNRDTEWRSIRVSPEALRWSEEHTGVKRTFEQALMHGVAHSSGGILGYPQETPENDMYSIVKENKLRLPDDQLQEHITLSKEDQAEYESNLKAYLPELWSP